ncbi:S8 family serine peptidase [Gramella lutea]|uniref:S8 family serine peptidase n=1 Tax=Christiangramia lutea TaxID=1607951 RepID=A0A9X1V5F8_9FLAO|nr:S8 family serine peptidase [Christiangramia lutea]MCH4824165.1 S8 family serine peptidase [Christiangramia lutea]
MKKTITSVWKLWAAVFILGVFLTSCEKDENPVQNNEQASADLKEPSFKNYLVISDQNSGSTKAAENYLKSVKGVKIINSIPELGLTVINTEDLSLLNKAQDKNLTIVPDYEIKWIPTAEATEQNLGAGEYFYEVGYLWGIDAVNAPEAWEMGYTGKGASVYVLDSGIDPDHFDLAPNVNTELSVSFIEGESWIVGPEVGFNHGTHVAGTIAAADTNYGLIGVAPEAELVAVKVLSEVSGSGPFSAINSGLYYAGSNGADVVNMSLGATFQKNGKLTDADGNEYKIPAKFVQEIIKAQQRAVDYAVSMGTTVIASAGNDYYNFDGFESYIKLPGSLNNVITVSATAPQAYFPGDYDGSFDIPSSYTNYGRSLIDVAAPGGDFDGPTYGADGILSAGNNNSFYWSSGTSMAAPHVAGVAALIIAKNGEMNPKDVQRQIENTSDKVDGMGKSLYLGQGRVNALRAVTE